MNNKIQAYAEAIKLLEECYSKMTSLYSTLTDEERKDYLMANKECEIINKALKALNKSYTEELNKVLCKK